ncbi:MAG: glycosyltransferase family 2 protein [Candidatus Cloacimonadota bacterium]|nr:MAG: glycosyltransferase family 2 protein [Candidatus Cloacimonadota bacterium]
MLWEEGGPYGARNKGIEIARGEIIAFTDPDRYFAFLPVQCIRHFK